MINNAIFVFSGNCRSFIDCFESSYDSIISKLFLNNGYNIFIYLYLKLTDPGPKGQGGWDYTYDIINSDIIINKINEIKDKYKELNIDYKLIVSDEITDNELLSQVKDRTKYIGFYNEDSKLLRGMHCHYNFERCGKYILEKESATNILFNYIIYIRPDLYFTEPCFHIDTYDNNIITLGNGPGGPNDNNNDHIAIIPRKHFESFFFDRMNIYRNNTTHIFEIAENVYRHTIQYKGNNIGRYFIKRS